MPSFPWTNSYRLGSDLRDAVQALKDVTPAGVLLGSGTPAWDLERLNLIDEYQLVLHPRIAGHGPTLYHDGLPATRRLERLSTKTFRTGAVARHYRALRLRLGTDSHAQQTLSASANSLSPSPVLQMRALVPGAEDNEGLELNCVKSEAAHSGRGKGTVTGPLRVDSATNEPEVPADSTTE